MITRSVDGNSDNINRFQGQHECMAHPGPESGIHERLLSIFSARRSDYSDRELMARSLCVEDHQNPDYCVVANIREIGGGLCACRCERYAWEDYLAAADAILLAASRIGDEYPQSPDIGFHFADKAVF